MKRTLFAAALLALLLSACGPKATPTPDPIQVQASAVAAANTMVALTQAAIPTATPIPPTPPPSPTPLPSPTLIPLPTLPEITQPTGIPTSSGAGNDPCQGPLPKDAAGPNARNVVIINETSGSVVLSLYLNKTPFGECGYRSFNLGPRQNLTVSDLKAGCYNAGAFITGKTPSKAFGYFCIPDDGHKYTIRVGTEVISL